MRERIEGVLVDARSLGGIATTLAFPEFDLSIDVGVCTAASLRTTTVALTHTHADHMAGLHTWLAVRRLFGMNLPRVVAPAASLPALRDCVDALGRLQGRPFDVELLGVEAGDEVPLARGTFLRAFPVDHGVPAVGWCVLRRLQKLKPRHLGLSSAEIARRKKDPVADLFDDVEDPLFAVTGDSKIGWIERAGDLVARARVLFVEATFVGERHDLAATHAGSHTHLDELAPRLAGLGCRAFVLYHFSQTYGSEDLVAQIRRRLPPDVADLVHLLLPEEGDRL
jgi:ribonuclease Z